MKIRKITPIAKVNKKAQDIDKKKSNYTIRNMIKDLIKWEKFVSFNE